VNFGEPIRLDAILERTRPGLAANTVGDTERKPEWMGAAVDELAQCIQVNVNRAADVNPINLLAMALLSTPKHAMAEADLLVQLDLFEVLAGGGSAILGSRHRDRSSRRRRSSPMARKMKTLVRTRHPLGDVLGFDGENAVLQSYFRNNVLHLFALRRLGGLLLPDQQAHEPGRRGAAGPAGVSVPAGRSCSCRGAKTSSANSCRPRWRC
jgi:glycerol-3-phosphate O-acyltransferase